MKLNKGTKAPDFQLSSTEDREFRLKEREGKWTVLYFYPKDFTYGCTKEACSFRDEFEAFRDLDIDIFGVSRDGIGTHKRFRKELDLPFHLLSDKNLSVSKKYNAVIPMIGMPKRITYLINPELKVEGVYESMTGFRKHVKKILALRN